MSVSAVHNEESKKQLVVWIVPNQIYEQNKNRRKAIFNWAARGLFFSEGRGRLYTLRLP